MSVAERVEVVRDGSAGDQVISGKTLKEYKKLLQAFFKFLRLKRIIEANPTENMFF